MLSTAFWMQNRSWDAAQAGRHALDRQGRQRHHRPALQQAQRTLPGFLGTPLRAKAGGCMTSLNLMCARDGRLPSALSFPRLLAPVHPEAEPKGAAFLCAFRNVPCSSSRNASRNRSEEHTSELQSRLHLVCRLLLEKKKNHTTRRLSELSSGYAPRVSH